MLMLGPVAQTFHCKSIVNQLTRPPRRIVKKRAAWTLDEPFWLGQSLRFEHARQQ